MTAHIAFGEFAAAHPRESGERDTCQKLPGGDLHGGKASTWRSRLLGKLNGPTGHGGPREGETVIPFGHGLSEVRDWTIRAAGDFFRFRTEVRGSADNHARHIVASCSYEVDLFGGRWPVLQLI
jgi:hypothetical protein